MKPLYHHVCFTSSERNITLKSEWNEGLQQAAARQKAKNDFQQMQAELKLAGRAAVMVCIKSCSP